MTSPCPPCRYDPCACEAGVAYQQQIDARNAAMAPIPTAAQLWGCEGFAECADSDCVLPRYHDGAHAPDEVVHAADYTEIEEVDSRSSFSSPA